MGRCQRLDYNGRRTAFHAAVAEAGSIPLLKYSFQPIRYRLLSPGADMRRREFLGIIGGTAAGWPLAARAQRAMPVIGFLRSAPITDVPHLVKAFRDGLKEAGFIEGQNLTIEYRSGNDNRDRMIEQVRELIQRPVDVIVGNVVAATVAKAATATIPIVFAT